MGAAQRQDRHSRRHRRRIRRPAATCRTGNRGRVALSLLRQHVRSTAARDRGAGPRGDAPYLLSGNHSRQRIDDARSEHTMPTSLEVLLIIFSALTSLSILTIKLSVRFGIPSLVPFLVIGMLAGSDGLGGLYFDNPALVQSLGVIALVFILFSGGLDTEWEGVRPVIWSGLSLSTVGVILTAVTVGWFVSVVQGLSFLEGLLLGAIVSSTDAAAVCMVLRARNAKIPKKLANLLELESGSNDPMGVVL